MHLRSHDTDVGLSFRRPSDSEHDDLIVGSHTSSEAPIVIGGTSIGIPASREDDPSLTQTHDPVVVARDEAQDPLTLSQLSPWKRDSTTAAPDPEAEVGMDVDREEPPTRKRPASPSPIVSCESKKGKFEKLGVLGVGVPPRAPSTKRARPPARTASVNQSRAQTKRASKVRARDVSLAKVAESTRVQKSAGSTSSRSLKRTDNSSAITSGVASSSAITQSSSEKDKKKVTVPQSIASATVSVAFNYQLDAKKDVRREDGSRPASSGSTNRKASSHAVPDFKSLHASLDAQRAIRRVTPTVPIPIVFHTDVRAKEREAFDEQVREKEREREAEKELTQREREEEEVREVRELRKRAVPKAHEVPAWYKDVPRTRRENGASQK
ncbi:hypothetical protein B0H10DRAFT_673261 [Mycena sp. CBHHK59/15]|nr:hypothetical protein B0H10DRAFT_673261 [Mycena sp. CBHHK59/15]